MNLVKITEMINLLENLIIPDKAGIGARVSGYRSAWNTLDFRGTIIETGSTRSLVAWSLYSLDL